MLKRNALKRIIISSMGLLLLFLIYIFPTNLKNESNTNFQNDILTYKEVVPIYVNNSNNYLARIDIPALEKDNITYIIDLLTINSISNNKLPKGFIGVIPQNTKLIDYYLDNKMLTLNFSKELLNTTDLNKIIESITYTMCDIDGISSIKLLIENIPLEDISSNDNYTVSTFNRRFGINKEYNLNTFKDITATTIYYINEEEVISYIPITKYTNNNMEKVEIIVNELQTSPLIGSNFISYLTAAYELKDYQILENAITLSFNNNLIAGLDDKNIIEELKYSLVLSLRDSYDIEDITININ